MNGCMLRTAWSMTVVLGLGLSLAVAGSAAAAEIAPHRALYKMSLGRAGGDSGVTAASGTMAYKWARPATAGPSSSATA